MEIESKIRRFREQATRVLNLEADFDLIRELFEFQAIHNPVFSDYLRLTNRSTTVRSPEDLTFMPVGLFKRQRVRTGQWKEDALFLSSGTTTQERSHHYLDDLQAYHKRTLACFEYTMSPVSESVHLAFLPFYEQNPHSSLIAMMLHFVEASQQNGSRFIRSEEELDEAIRNLDTVKPVYIWTVTYGLLDFVKHSQVAVLDGFTIIETGGMKGRRKEVTRQEIHSEVHNRWPGVKIGSEYGMAELMSQAYLIEKAFKTPPGLLVVAGDVDDPFNIRSKGRRSQLKFIDMANAHSCAFIATQDVGEVLDQRTFRVSGRMDHAEMRGCNLLYE